MKYGIYWSKIRSWKLYSPSAPHPHPHSLPSPTPLSRLPSTRRMDYKRDFRSKTMKHVVIKEIWRHDGSKFDIKNLKKLQSTPWLILSDHLHAVLETKWRKVGHLGHFMCGWKFQARCVESFLHIGIITHANGPELNRKTCGGEKHAY